VVGVAPSIDTRFDAANWRVCATSPRQVGEFEVGFGGEKDPDGVDAESGAKRDVEEGQEGEDEEADAGPGLVIHEADARGDSDDGDDAHEAADGGEQRADEQGSVHVMQEWPADGAEAEGAESGDEVDEGIDDPEHAEDRGMAGDTAAKVGVRGGSGPGEGLAARVAELLGVRELDAAFVTVHMLLPDWAVREYEPGI